jgi:hypothetical protein
VDRLNEIITGVFPETGALHEILARAGCVSVNKQQYDALRAEVTRLRAALMDIERNARESKDGFEQDLPDLLGWIADLAQAALTAPAAPQAGDAARAQNHE